MQEDWEKRATVSVYDTLGQTRTYKSAPMEPILTIVPRLREAMCGITALAMRMTEKTFVSYIRMISWMSTSMRAPMQ